jgi:hypothetical protein
MAGRAGACEHGPMNKGIARPVRWRLAGVAVLAALLVGLGVCEALGWPFLAAPMQRWIGDALQRRVSLSADPAQAPQANIHLLGGIRIAAPQIEIGAPAWSTAPYTLRARDARLTLAYADLWRVRRGEPLHIRELRAARLEGQLERRADGHASWQFGTRTDTPDTAEPPARTPSFGRLQVDSGTMALHDALMGVDLDATFSLVDGVEVSAAGLAASGPAPGLNFSAKGMYRKKPLTIEAHASGVLPAIADDAASVALPVSIKARVGGATLSFDGTATDALRLTSLQGRFSVQGPSLAAVGDPLRVTLPTTAPFRAEGLVAKQGVVWNAVLERVGIGASRLAGAFTYDPRPHRPLLAGRLTGSKLMLADLGPTIGAPVRDTAAASPAAALRSPTAGTGHVLPDRAFDLPSLRAMDANVLIDIDSLDSGSPLLEPLKPLRTHLVLSDGVLVLRDLEARTGQGHLAGTLQLDGRGALALWTADLRWDGVRLERWIHQPRANNAPPYASGSLNGRARVAGQGKSTAAILGGLRGEVRMHLVDGTISHLAVEAAGLDIAQGLGVFLKGDDALPVQCGVFDLVAEQGLLRPRVAVLDTRDSTLWIDGTLSLATELLDLRVVVTPKDFSPLALRAPLQLRGSFSSPRVSIDKGKLGTRLGAAAVLALVNPLAAVIPLIDIGNAADAQRGGDDCRALSARIKTAPELAPPRPAKR